MGIMNFFGKMVAGDDPLQPLYDRMKKIRNFAFPNGEQDMIHHTCELYVIFNKKIPPEKCRQIVNILLGDIAYGMHTGTSLIDTYNKNLKYINNYGLSSNDLLNMINYTNKFFFHNRCT